MRLSLAPLLLATAQVAAFAPSSSLLKVRKTLRQNDGGLAMSSPGGGKKVLTEADVMAKSAANQKASGGGGGDDPSAPGTQDAPKIFTPATYDDFQSSLQLLEKRAKGGPGSLTLDEVERFEEETGRVMKEMREFMADPEGVGERIRKSHEGGSAAVMDVKSTAVKEPIAPIPSKPSTIVEASTVASPSPAAVTSPLEIPPDYTKVAPNDDSINFGLARGTANTYSIPGMDEMSPEEYRAKLQETVSAHQAHRRKLSLSQTGTKRIGNLSSNGYLDGLSGGGQEG